MESIQAVANRIQERGLALASEKAQESILMEQYKELEQKEKAESKVNEMGKIMKEKDYDILFSI